MGKYQIHKAALESDYTYASQLIESKEDLDELDLKGHTALHWAVFSGDIDFVMLLLEAGANPNIFSDDGVTPRWRARDFCLEEIEELLNSYGGKILTNERFDGISFSVFNSAIGQPLQVENALDRDAGDVVGKRKWWQLWKFI